MTKKVKLSIMICGGALAFAILLFYLILPYWIRHEVVSQVNEKCSRCEFQLRDVDLEIFPLKLILQDIHLVTGDSKSTLIDAKSARVELELSVFSLLNQVMKFQRIVIHRPEVVITEGDEKGKRTPASESKSDWMFEVKKTEIGEGVFDYHRIHLGKKASIHLDRINGGIGEFGSISRLHDEQLTAQVTAILENSGKVDLSVKTPLFLEPLQVDVVLSVAHLNLQKVSPYFYRNAGIAIKGTLFQGNGKASIREKNLQTEVYARYEGLGIDFSKTLERSELTAVLSNLFSGIKSKNDRMKKARSTRQWDEPLVGFIFRGMMEATLKVVTD